MEGERDWKKRRLRSRHTSFIKFIRRVFADDRSDGEVLAAPCYCGERRDKHVCVETMVYSTPRAQRRTRVVLAIGYWDDAKLFTPCVIEKGMAEQVLT